MVSLLYIWALSVDHCPSILSTERNSIVVQCHCQPQCPTYAIGLMACLQIFVWNGHQVTLHALRASINWGTTAPPPRGQVMPTIFERSSHEELPNIEAVPLPLSPVAFHWYCDEVNKMWLCALKWISLTHILNSSSTVCTLDFRGSQLQGWCGLVGAKLFHWGWPGDALLLGAIVLIGMKYEL